MTQTPSNDGNVPGTEPPSENAPTPSAHGWIVEVLEDIVAYCDRNDLGTTARAVREALDTARQTVDG